MRVSHLRFLPVGFFLQSSHAVEEPTATSWLFYVTNVMCSLKFQLSLWFVPLEFRKLFKIRRFHGVAAMTIVFFYCSTAVFTHLKIVHGSHHVTIEYRGIFHGTYRGATQLVPPNTSFP